MSDLPQIDARISELLREAPSTQRPRNWNVPELESQPDASPLLLVVDDDARVRQSVRALLSTNQYDSLAAENVDQAREILGKECIDLLILDINMPGPSGFELLRELKEKRPELAVILVSGETTFDNATLALREGARDFLRKPYRPDDLLLTVRRVLEQRRLEQEIARMQLQLAISEQRHRFIVDNSPDMIYMLDGEGRFTFVNSRITKLLGYRPEEIVGRHYSELVHLDDIEKARYLLNERRGGDRASRNVEFRLVHKDVERDVVNAELWTVPIELNSMGVYFSNEDQPEPYFAGTYGVARDISERKRSEALIKYQLSHDLLTGLPNRGLFQDRLAQAHSQAMRKGNSFALLYLDIDRFKMINDSYGHLVGDELLQTVSRIIGKQLRESDTLGRISGDEFNILLHEVSNDQDASHVAEKIIGRFKDPVIIRGKEISVSLSIGIAIYPQHGESLQELIHNADVAMYHVKSHGKRGCALYDSCMQSFGFIHPSWEGEITKALSENQFELRLQPQEDTASGRLVGAEALIRWQHPEKGLVMPAEFISHAEETGHIVEIGEWVLRESCRILSQHLQQPGLSDVKVSVNISARQLVESNFVSMVRQVLREYGVSPCRVMLEVTENILLQDMEQASVKLKELTELGIRIAIDDFGVGYSSLSYLQSLPLHTLKIDRSFIARINSSQEKHSIVSSVLVMARELGLDVVAEGIETEAQLAYLRDAKCPTVQGFLLGRPMTVLELVEKYGSQQLVAESP